MVNKILQTKNPLSNTGVMLAKINQKIDLADSLGGLFALKPVDITNIAYMGILGVLIWVFRENLPRWELFVTLHMVGIAGIMLLSNVVSRRPANRYLAFVQTWYSLPLFLLLFEEVHLTVHLIYSGWFDAIVLKLEYGLFGVHPTVWFEKFASPALTEYMNFAYFSYFLLIPAGGLALVLTKQNQLVGKLMFACAVAYYICYILFHLFPIEGPYHTVGHLQQVELSGGVFTSLVNWLEGFGRIHGGALPSAHVAGATVVLLFMWAYARKTVWIFAPVIISLYISTVYLRYHYASDVPTGIIVGIVATILVFRWGRDKKRIPQKYRLINKGLVFITLFTAMISANNVGATTLMEFQDQDVREIISLTLNFEFEEADDRVEELLRQYPDDPVPRLLKSEILWWMHINNRDSQPLRSALLKNANKCIAFAETRIANDSKDLVSLFAAGSGHARVAAVYGMEEKKWEAVQEAMKARKLFKKLHRAAPDFCDVYAHLGIYEYYAAQQGIAARLLGGMMYGLFGDREKGIEYLKKSIQCGDYSAPEASFYLALFYVHWEKNVKGAIPILEQLTQQFPGNLCFKGIHAFALGKKGELNTAVTMYREILETAETRDLYGTEGYATTRYFLADFLAQNGQYEQAAAELDWIIDADLKNSYWLTSHSLLARSRISLALGDQESARQDLYAVLDLKDNDNSHKQSRELLRSIN